MDITANESPLITAENRPALQKHMEKFDSFEAAALDGMDLKRQTGAPFKLMESMASLPDDAARLDFTTKANKLLGREFVGDITGLADLDLRAGAADDTAMDDNLATSFKQFIVDNHVDKKTAQLMVGFHNKAMGTAREALGVTTKAAADTAAAEHIVAVRTCNEAMVAHKSYGSQEEVDKQTVLLHRALKDNIGISTERAEEISEFLKSGVGATDPIVRHAMLQTFAKLAAESSTEGPGIGAAKVTTEKSKADRQVEKDIWGEQEA